jgi:hypothetical protein
MPENDPLLRLLQSADAAANTPLVAADLLQRVRQRQATKAARTRRIAAAGMTVSAALLIVVFVRNGRQSTVDQSPSQINAAELTQLRAEANAFKAEADALQRMVDKMRTRDSRLDLVDEHHKIAVASAAGDSMDRIAMLALCRGDFLWQEYRARESAAEAWQSVVDNFPDTQAALAAHQRIRQLQMN